MHRLAIAPKPEQCRLTGGDAEDSLAPRVRIDDDARPRPVRRNHLAFVLEGRDEGHGATPPASSTSPCFFRMRRWLG